MAGIGWGSLRSGHIGYWIGHEFAGRGITPLAVALATDHCLRVVGLHRVEINIRPENAPSLRVVEKLGFRDEGLRERYLHIDGAWRDHRTFALTAEEPRPRRPPRRRHPPPPLTPFRASARFPHVNPLRGASAAG
ncbi:hypothetical protein GCM10025868_15500 [Angustibacter aerolatus]|uniref:N-acetyltransferase domain-containing protein n=1 Tax=Angustibacter aerolatus TaxID=1162965 RepID=A0ABQ6JGG6_9ACTN|nr:GNAT family protein [Angustibacter aerolatus]GMA86300.1 hypothetical protein GCM10025868_15500 [Angustibacter aerolatus]